MKKTAAELCVILTAIVATQLHAGGDPEAIIAALLVNVCTLAEAIDMIPSELKREVDRTFAVLTSDSVQVQERPARMMS